MLKVKVDGSGIIPRGLGLAPLKKAVPMDKRTIQAIFLYPDLKCKYMRADGSFAELTPSNIQRVWKSDANKFIEIERAAREGKPVTEAQRRKLVNEVSSTTNNTNTKKVVEQPQQSANTPNPVKADEVVKPAEEKNEPIVVQSGSEIVEEIKNDKSNKNNKYDKNNKNKNSNNWPESESNNSVEPFSKK